MIADVTCYSLSDFRGLAPDASTAVISIHDDSQTVVALDGWGPSIVCFFTDVEYDSGYLQRWGWSFAIQAGLFTPTMARNIRAFLARHDVQQCQRLVIHCYAGQSRSVAVGMHASRLLGSRLELTKRAQPNKTVSLLLREPDALGDDTAHVRDAESRRARGQSRSAFARLLSWVGVG